MSHCYKHPNAETELRCSKCEKYLCDKCACVTTVGYRCRECAHEKSVVYSVPVPLMVGSSVLGAACGFAASYFVSHSGTFFVLFLGAIIGSGVGELLYRVMGRRASPVVGAITALGFLAGVVFEPIRTVLRESANGGSPGFVVDAWGIIFAAIAGGAAWLRLK